MKDLVLTAAALAGLGALAAMALEPLITDLFGHRKGARRP